MVQTQCDFNLSSNKNYIGREKCNSWLCISCRCEKVYLEEEPKVAAVGAGLEIGKPSGNMVLDIGGGTSDIAVLSLGDIVCSTSIKVAGERLSHDIIEGVRLHKKMYIGEQTGDEIKQKIGTAIKMENPEVITVSGRDVETRTST